MLRESLNPGPELENSQGQNSAQSREMRALHLRYHAVHDPRTDLAAARERGRDLLKKRITPRRRDLG